MQPQPQAAQPGRSLIRNLLLAMLAFGAVVGVVFPPFAWLTLGTDKALTVLFWAMCISAGLLVGWVNFRIFRSVVLKEIFRVVEGMDKINEMVAHAKASGQECGEDCRLEINSDDEIGHVAQRFNSMTDAIATRVSNDGTIRTLQAELVKSVDTEHVSNAILSALMDVCGAKAGVLYGNDGGEYKLFASTGVDKTEALPETIDTTQGFTTKALDTGQTMVIEPEQGDLDWFTVSTPLGTLKPASYVVAPLSAEQQPAGVVAFACSGSTDPGKMELFELLRENGAPYLQNAILHRKISDLAAIDELTRILNRRFGMRRMEEEFARSTRHGVPISLMMFDIDHFKRINDDFGHDAGDAVLRSLPTMIERNMRSGDVFFRFGGEEFVLVIPGTGQQDAVVLGERMRRIVEGHRINWADQQLSVTISIGISTWPLARVSTAEELLTKADQALIFSKNSGRNRVSVFSSDKPETPDLNDPNREPDN